MTKTMIKKSLRAYISRDEHMHPKQRMQAIDILNKMDAVYLQRVDASVHGDLSDAAAKVQAILDE